MNSAEYERLGSIVQETSEREQERYPFNRWLGDERQRRALQALMHMRNAGTILAFLPTGRLSYADLIKGIDFYVVVRGVYKRLVIPFDVGGEPWAGLKAERHPGVFPVSIDLFDALELVEFKFHIAIELVRALDRLEIQ